MKIVLASGSPRRRELLQQIGFEFEVVVSDCDETINSTHPGDVVEELALKKATAVAEQLNVQADTIVIGADTVVAYKHVILGKPKDEAEAFSMLSKLQGNVHEVYTGVSMVFLKGGRITQRSYYHEVTRVSFYPMTESEIREYIATGDCMDKAGSYGIQGFCARYIQKIDGDYNNVVGLPIGSLYQMLKEYL